MLQIYKVAHTARSCISFNKNLVIMLSVAQYCGWRFYCFKCTCFNWTPQCCLGTIVPWLSLKFLIIVSSCPATNVCIIIGNLTVYAACRGEWVCMCTWRMGWWWKGWGHKSTGTSCNNWIKAYCCSTLYYLTIKQWCGLVKGSMHLWANS